jgi:uncharacterized protein
MKQFFWVILFCLSLSQAAIAETPTRSSIEKLLLITNVEKRIDAQYSAMLPMFTDIFKKMTPANISSPESTEVYNIMLQKMITLMRKELGWSAIKEDYIKLYADSLTQVEINDLLKFYQSPTGKSYLEKLPILTQQVTEIAKRKTEPLYPQIQTIIQDSVEELKKKYSQKKY